MGNIIFVNILKCNENNATIIKTFFISIIMLVNLGFRSQQKTRYKKWTCKEHCDCEMIGRFQIRTFRWEKRVVHSCVCGQNFPSQQKKRI